MSDQHPNPTPTELAVPEENILEQDLNLSGEDEDTALLDEQPQPQSLPVPQDSGEPKGKKKKKK
jgi:hypothetical protein